MNSIAVALLLGALFTGGFIGGFWIGRDYELRKWMRREDDFFLQLVRHRISQFEPGTNDD